MSQKNPNRKEGKMIPNWLCVIAMGATWASGFILGYWYAHFILRKLNPNLKTPKET